MQRLINGNYTEVNQISNTGISCAMFKVNFDQKNCVSYTKKYSNLINLTNNNNAL